MTSPGPLGSWDQHRSGDARGLVGLEAQVPGCCGPALYIWKACRLPSPMERRWRDPVGGVGWGQHALSGLSQPPAYLRG